MDKCKERGGTDRFIDLPADQGNALCEMVGDLPQITMFRFFALATRLPASRIAAANLDPALAPRPVHWVLALGLLVPVRVLLRRRAAGVGREALSP